MKDPTTPLSSDETLSTAESLAKKAVKTLLFNDPESFRHLEELIAASKTPPPPSRNPVMKDTCTWGVLLATITTSFGKLKTIHNPMRSPKPCYTYTLPATDITSLCNLVFTRSSVNVKDCKNLKTLGVLETVGSECNISDSGVEDIGNLKKVEGNFYATGISIKAMYQIAERLKNGTLTTWSEPWIGGVEEGMEKILELEDLILCSLSLNEAKIKTLGPLKRAGHVSIEGNPYIEDTGNLEEIKGCFHCAGTKLKSFGKIKHIGRGGRLPLELEDLGDLETSGTLVLRGMSKLKSAGKLKKVTGELIITGTSFEFQTDLLNRIEAGVLEVESIDLRGCDFLTQLRAYPLGKVIKRGVRTDENFRDLIETLILGEGAKVLQEIFRIGNPEKEKYIQIFNKMFIDIHGIFEESTEERKPFFEQIFDGILKSYLSCLEKYIGTIDPNGNIENQVNTCIYDKALILEKLFVPIMGQNWVDRKFQQIEGNKKS